MIHRGDICWVDLDPTVGSEQNKRRPVVVVTNNGANGIVDQNRRGVLTVVPVTSNVSRVYPFQVLLPAARVSGLRNDSKALAEQIRSVDYSRIGPSVGSLPRDLLDELDAAIRLHLAL